MSQVPLVNGSFCIDGVSISVGADETVRRLRGPDFDVYYVAGASGERWGVYAGGYPMAAAAGTRPFVERDGVKIFRAIEDQKQNGYVAVDGQYWKYHFFGSVFRNNATDRAFFDRVQFGAPARKLCGSRPPP